MFEWPFLFAGLFGSLLPPEFLIGLLYTDRIQISILEHQFKLSFSNFIKTS